MELNVDITGATPVHPARFDWEPPVERLRSEAAMARDSGRPDPWTLVEAECWIDLIDAELSAQRSGRDPGTRSAAISLLRHWRAELQLIVRQLQQLPVRERADGAPEHPRYPQPRQKFCA